MTPLGPNEVTYRSMATMRERKGPGDRKRSLGRGRIKTPSSEGGDCGRRRSSVLPLLLICATIVVSAENVTADSLDDIFAPLETTPERQFWNEVLERARSCVKAKEFSLPALCFLKSTPEKCQPLVYDAVLGGGRKEKWYLCVISCADAGWYSRIFGACSRELD